jgi:UDP-glucose 4-epimerase
MSKNFKSSVVTITGGTGSFGSTMVKDLLAQDVSEIRIFSRDENKMGASASLLETSVMWQVLKM